MTGNFSFKVNHFLESNGRDLVRPEAEALLSLTHPGDELDTFTNIFWEKRLSQMRGSRSETQLPRTTTCQSHPTPPLASTCTHMYIAIQTCIYVIYHTHADRDPKNKNHLALKAARPVYISTFWHVAGAQ